MPNTIANSTWVTKEVARGYTNNVVFVNQINRSYDDQYEINGAKVGNTVLARMPQRWAAMDGQALQLQSIYDQTVPITLTNQKQVAFPYSSAEATTELDSIRERYVNPGAESLANAADVLAMAAIYKDIWNTVGTPGTTPSARMTFLTAGVLLTDQSAPSGGRKAVLDAMASATMSDNTATLFGLGGAVTKNFEKGQFSGPALGIDAWLVDPNRPVHTTGTFTASTPVVNGAGQTGASLVTSGWASGASSLKKGDSFTIAGVNSVNPQSYNSNGRLQKFVVTSDISDTTGAMTIGISPSIITSGQLQTVDASPANSAAISVWSANPAGGTLATATSPQSLVFHRDFAAFVMADLVKPNGGAKSTTVRSKALGFSIRFVEQYQATTDQNVNRLDILIGAATLQPRLAVRVVG